MVIIPLGTGLPRFSSDLPALQSPEMENWPGQPLQSLFGLAPRGVYRAFDVTTEAVGSYPTISPLPRSRGGMFSVALSVGLPPLPVRKHAALRCSDFPPSRPEGAERRSPALLDL